MLQHTSVYALPDLAEFSKQHNMYLSMTTVGGESYLKLNSVPSEHLIAFRSWVENNTTLDDQQRSLIVGMIDSANFDAELYRKFKEYVDLLDSIRNTEYFSVFPQARI